MRNLALGFVVPFLLVACKGSPAGSPTPTPAVAGEAGAATPAPTKADPSDSAAALTLEQTIEKYVRAGGAGADLEAAHALIDPRCKDDENVWKVDPAIMMGSRITIAKVSLEIVSQDDDKAVVAATVGGDIKAAESETDSIMGQKAKLQIKGLEMSDVSLTQPVQAVRVDGRWLIGCSATK